LGWIRKFAAWILRRGARVSPPAFASAEIRGVLSTGEKIMEWLTLLELLRSSAQIVYAKIQAANGPAKVLAKIQEALDDLAEARDAVISLAQEELLRTAPQWPDATSKALAAAATPAIDTAGPAVPGIVAPATPVQHRCPFCGAFMDLGAPGEICPACGKLHP
jgi:hypothetical protein